MPAMRVALVGADIRPLTRAMNRLGKDARPVFRDVGDAVAKVAARDIGVAAARHSSQSRSMLRAVMARRDRVPYVTVHGGRIYRRNGGNRRSAVRVKHLAHAVEFGTRSLNTRHQQITRAHGTRPQRWLPTGWWFYPTIDANIPRYTGLYARALSRLVDDTVRRL